MPVHPESQCLPVIPMHVFETDKGSGPFIATPIASNKKWYYTYAVEAGLGVLNLAFVCVGFGRDMLEARKQRRTEARDAETQDAAARGTEATSVALEDTRSRNKEAFQQIQQTLKLRAVWLISLFFFFFLGAAITASGKWCH